MDNREKILACALELFTARGFDAVGVQEVADAAGLKKPTLYHYFGSKSGLLRTLLVENFEKLFDEVEKAADYQAEQGRASLFRICPPKPTTLPVAAFDVVRSGRQ
jgi:AcrR family transcriptional regulator